MHVWNDIPYSWIRKSIKMFLAQSNLWVHCNQFKILMKFLPDFETNSKIYLNIKTPKPKQF